MTSDFKVKRVNVEKIEALKVLNNLNIDIELKQPMVESSEGKLRPLDARTSYT